MSVADSLIQASLLGEAVDNGPAAVFVADENRTYVAVNRAACELLGYTRAELLALRVDDVADTSAWDELERNGQHSATAELKRKDGTTVAFSYVAGRTVVAGIPVYVSVGT